MKKIIPTAIAAIGLAGCSLIQCFNKGYVEAEYGDNEIRLYTQPLAYEVLRYGKVLVAKTEIGLVLDGVKTDANAKIVKVEQAVLSGKEDTPVYKKSSVDLSGVQTYVDFGDFGVRLAAREDGVAYRFETKKAATINYENAPITIPAKSARTWFNKTWDRRMGCEESVPEMADAANLKSPKDKYIYLPFVYSVDGTIVAVTESDVHNYPVWNFDKVTQGEDTVKLSAAFEGYPKSVFREGGASKGMTRGGRWVRISEHENFLVKSDSARTLPWRTFVLADTPADLVENDIVFALAEPKEKGADFSWVKPGKVAWDWWNNFDNLGYGKGCTTEGYKRFIDFAAKTGVEYVIFDEGWSANLNIWKYSDKVDVPALIKYAESKGVGIILWMAWAQTYGEEEKVVEYFSKLGAKGFKVDFMDRGDAEIAVFLEKFAAICAKHKMIVDYHGVYRPVGLHRKYPNIVNYEGIHGLEQLKWGRRDKDMPYNDVACFFLRMTAGPMDYTPGAMDNYKIGDYRGNNTHPGSVGTRCHQIALMSLYEAPLQMLADSPTKYEKNMECFSFMAKTPVVWEETVGLGGCPESFAAVARKAKNGSWYASGITDRNARTFELDTSFLGEGAWTAEVFRDSSECNEQPSKFIHETITVKAGEKIKIWMANGGGFAIHFTK